MSPSISGALAQPHLPVFICLSAHICARGALDRQVFCTNLDIHGPWPVPVYPYCSPTAEYIRNRWWLCAHCLEPLYTERRISNLECDLQSSIRPLIVVELGFQAKNRQKEIRPRNYVTLGLAHPSRRSWISWLFYYYVEVLG
jgi:hypothetical protein